MSVGTVVETWFETTGDNGFDDVPPIMALLWLDISVIDNVPGNSDDTLSSDLDADWDSIIKVDSREFDALPTEVLSGEVRVD